MPKAPSQGPAVFARSSVGNGYCLPSLGPQPRAAVNAPFARFTSLGGGDIADMIG